MKLIHVALLAVAPIFAFAQTPAPKAPASTPATSAPAKEQAKKEPTCEKKEMKNGKCPKVFPKAPKPTDKQLQDAKKKADAKK